MKCYCYLLLLFLGFASAALWSFAKAPASAMLLTISRKVLRWSSTWIVTAQTIQKSRCNSTCCRFALLGPALWQSLSAAVSPFSNCGTTSAYLLGEQEQVWLRFQRDFQGNVRCGVSASGVHRWWKWTETFRVLLFLVILWCPFCMWWFCPVLHSILKFLCKRLSNLFTVFCSRSLSLIYLPSSFLSSVKLQKSDILGRKTIWFTTQPQLRQSQ